MIVAGTGHRPPKLGGYSPAVFQQCARTATTWLKRNTPEEVISGMALGWDQALAYAAIKLGIPVRAYIPFVGQADNWPAGSHELYGRILMKCEVKRISIDFHPRAMDDRNEAMVDDCDLVLALWDGSPGGTGNCIRYANDVGRQVVNLWDLFDL